MHNRSGQSTKLVSQSTHEPDASLRNELARLTRQLISYRTIDGNYAALNECLHFIGQYVSALDGLHFSHYTNRDCPYLVISNTDTKRPDIVLSGHIDVVPGAAEHFTPRVDGDRLYGRGALDMKGGVAALMLLFQHLARLPDAPSLALMLTSDEEQGSLGAYYLAHEQKWRPRFLLIPEGGSEFRLVAREKGCCWVQVQAKGRAAHSAYPWRGVNAAERLVRALAVVRELVPSPADAWQPTISVSSLTAGDQPVLNQVPDHAEAVLDIRYTDDWAKNGTEVLARLRAAVPSVDFELLANGDALAVSHSNPHLRRLQDITRNYFGKDFSLSYNHGASDAAGFAAFKIPAMTSGIVGADHHGDGEYVELQSLVDYYHIAREFVLSWPGA